jgi:hypothetical protein
MGTESAVLNGILEAVKNNGLASTGTLSTSTYIEQAVTGQSTGGFQLLGTWTGNVNIAVSIDGVNYSNLIGNTCIYDAINSVYKTSALITVNGQYVLNIAGLKGFRIIFTSGTGSITVNTIASPAPFAYSNALIWDATTTTVNAGNANWNTAYNNMLFTPRVQLLVSGSDFITQEYSGNAVSGSMNSGTTAYISKVSLPRKTVFTGIGARVTTLQAAQNIAVGLYVGNNLQTASYLGDSGNLSTATTGAKSGSFAAPLTLDPTLQYWTFFKVSSSVVQVRAATSPTYNILNTDGDFYPSATLAHAYANAFPATLSGATPNQTLTILTTLRTQ